MSEGLGKSKTTINTNIRSLSEIQLVERVWKKGVRKDLYAANSPLFKTFMRFHTKKWSEVTNNQKNLLVSIQGRLEGNTEGPPTDVDELSNRLKEIITFHDKIESVYNEVMKK